MNRASYRKTKNKTMDSLKIDELTMRLRALGDLCGEFLQTSIVNLT